MEILYIALGWLFGILSVPITLKIQKGYRKKEITKALVSELHNVAGRVTDTYYVINGHMGNINKEKLEWFKKQNEKYHPDTPSKILEAINKLLKMSDEEIKISSELIKLTRMSDINIKRFSVSYINSIINDISIFNPTIQMNILELKNQIDVINEIIENSRFHFNLTFDVACMERNKEIIRSNIDNSYIDVANQCKIILDRIDSILKMLE